MSKPANRRLDPLLAAVRLMLGASMVFMVAVSVTTFLSVPAMFALKDMILRHMARQGIPTEAYGTIVAVVALAAAIAALGFFFLRYLYRIVESVGEGDPFIPANADRLRAMAWISVAVHMLAIPIAVFGHWAEALSSRLKFEVAYPLTGLFMALVLFVLARVFREGARMREELEGTV